MKTPFQHFIQLAQRVLDVVDPTVEYTHRPASEISYIIKDVAIEFGLYPTTCMVQFYRQDDATTTATIQFYCPINYDCDGYDQLFVEWTKNVDDFLASDSILLLDNQIKAGLRK